VDSLCKTPLQITPDRNRRMLSQRREKDVFHSSRNTKHFLDITIAQSAFLLLTTAATTRRSRIAFQPSRIASAWLQLEDVAHTTWVLVW
jgi:hypothetical protein